MQELLARYDGPELHVPALRPRPYGAISGKPGWQLARWQAGSSLGPIVEGVYTARIHIDPAGARFKKVLDRDALTCKFEYSESIQEIRGMKQVLARQPGQTTLQIVDCSDAVGAWGRYRWRLTPDPKTAQTIAGYKRSGGFHIHGGGPSSMGTSGCIRVGDEFWSDLRGYIERHAKTLKTMKLTVQYSSRETSTGGVPR